MTAEVNDGLTMTAELGKGRDREEQMMMERRVRTAVDTRQGVGGEGICL